MLTEEQKKEVADKTEEFIKTWVKETIFGPVMLELLNGQTDLVFIGMEGLKETDRREVRSIIRRILQKEFLEAFKLFGEVSEDEMAK